jgi:hypothetical protein
MRDFSAQVVVKNRCISTTQHGVTFQKTIILKFTATENFRIETEGGSSETLVAIYQTTRHHIPEAAILVFTAVKVFMTQNAGRVYFRNVGNYLSSYLGLHPKRL